MGFGGGQGISQIIQMLGGGAFVGAALNDVFSNDPEIPRASFVDPGQAIIFNLLGIPTLFDQRTGTFSVGVGVPTGNAPISQFALADPAGGGDASTGIRGPGGDVRENLAGTRALLSGVTEPTPLTPLQLEAFDIVEGRGIPPALRRALDVFDETLIPRSEAIAAGERPDLDRAINLSTELFEQEFLPLAAERAVGFGAGPRSSDFQNSVAREASRRAAELGALDLDLENQALNRSLNAIPLAGLTATTRAALPQTFAADQLQIGELFRGANESQRQDRALLNLVLGKPFSAQILPQEILMSNTDLFRRNFAGESGRQMAQQLASQAGGFLSNSFGGFEFGGGGLGDLF